MLRCIRIILATIFFAVLLANQLSAQQRPIVLKAVTIIDGKGQILRNTIVVIEGEKIARIGGDAPAGAITYDLTQPTVAPGWIDTHAHIFWHFDNGRLAGKDEPPVRAILHAADNAIVTLDAGFTTMQTSALNPWASKTRSAPSHRAGMPTSLPWTVILFKIRRPLAV